jgi:hypothetical protein
VPIQHARVTHTAAWRGGWVTEAGNEPAEGMLAVCTARALQPHGLTRTRQRGHGRALGCEEISSCARGSTVALTGAAEIAKTVRLDFGF